jgi:uncharacterized protein (DUF1697 family)
MRQIVLLRGINLGPRNRIAMPALRQALADAGFKDIETYLQSGNIVLSSKASPKKLAAQVAEVISDGFGLEIPVMTRTRDELAQVVKRNPLAEAADDPKRYQVSFLSAELAQPELETLVALATESERLVAIGRELYAWHPDGVARSKLWNKLAGTGLGVTATARNWTTVTSLLELADQ